MPLGIPQLNAMSATLATCPAGCASYLLYLLISLLFVSFVLMSFFVLNIHSGLFPLILYLLFIPTVSTTRWLISGEPGTILRLTWLTFSLEESAGCLFDYVAVYDNSSSTPNIGKQLIFTTIIEYYTS